MAVAERIYRAMLRAYPEEFRREYGAQMLQAFRDLRREERRRGRMAGYLLWVRVFGDLAATAAAQRIDQRNGVREVRMRERWLAAMGFVLVLAPMYYVAASLMKYELGIGFLFDPLESVLSGTGTREAFNVVSPAVFFGGLGLALAANAYAVLRVEVARRGGEIVGTVRLEPRLWNVAAAAVSLCLLATLVGYVIAENFVYGP